MTFEQLQRRAEPDRSLIRLKPTDLIREEDYVEWMGGPWTSVDLGSEFIGKETQKCTGYGFARII